MKKFELTRDFITNGFGKKMYRIKALVEFGNVKAGEMGGFVQKEENLDQCGNAWIYNNATVYDNARVYGNAQVYGNAWVYGNAEICGNAQVYNDADYAYVHGFGSVYRTTTFFRTKDGGVGVRSGCFYGALQEFRNKVCERHGETKKAKEYLMLADLMELRFSGETDGD